MSQRTMAGAAALLLAALCMLGWRTDPAALLGAYLAAWWFWIGIALGGLANVWLHNLTGGAWGEPIRAPLLAAARSLLVAAPLFLPVLLGMHQLYPWAAAAGGGVARWQGELSAPAFKNAWLTPPFFVLRSVAYLLLWTALAWLSMRPSLQRSKPFAAAALIAYGFSLSLAALDWIMSLTPVWYSSVFGLLAGSAQMLAAMALAIVCVTRSAAAPGLLRDLGNLLLMYVMTWAYLAFMQFLIIWAANLPHEIAWYLPRARGAWLAIAWLQALLLFFAPLLILLSRRAKQAPRLLGTLAAALLALLLVNAWWLVLPSLPAAGAASLWAAPLAAAALGAMAWCWFAWREASHA